MYEPTHGGTWFKWSALDRREKLLVGSSLSLIGIATALTLKLTDSARSAYDLGYRAGSGGLTPPPPPPVQPGGTDALLTVIAVASLAAGIALWIAFSRRQDELFNRVQNRSYGIGSLATLGALGLWMAGDRVQLFPPPSAGWVIAIWLAVCSAIWIVDARRHWR